jgi:hypothetical protein
MTSALDDFTCLPKYRVALCKICHYCVWPGNARTHLREKHSRLSKAERALICDELQARQEISHSHEQFEVPQAVDQPIHSLHLFREGKQCRLEPVGDKTRDRRLNSHIVHHSTPSVSQDFEFQNCAAVVLSPRIHPSTASRSLPSTAIRTRP